MLSICPIKVCMEYNAYPPIGLNILFSFTSSVPPLLEFELLCPHGIRSDNSVLPVQTFNKSLGANVASLKGAAIISVRLNMVT